MASEDPFYIGWQDKAPGPYAKKTRLFVGLALLFLLLGGLAWVFGQRAFTGGTFEFGNLETVEGQLIRRPVPMLRIDYGDDPAGEAQVQEILLVGFGKFSAEPTLAAMERELGENINGRHLQLRGTLTYYDGKTVMELTEGTSAFVGWSAAPDHGRPSEALSNEITPELVSLRGEIIDPKCFFGVMKPGEGKPHKSCAARCLSGGIPAVFKSREADGHSRYFLLTNTNGQSLNKELLPFVADFLEVQGQTYALEDWDVLQIESTADLCPLGPKWLLAEMPMCEGD